MVRPARFPRTPFRSRCSTRQTSLVVLGGSGTNTFDVTPSPTYAITVDGGSGGNNTLTYHTGGSTTWSDDGSVDQRPGRRAGRHTTAASHGQRAVTPARRKGAGHPGRSPRRYGSEIPPSPALSFPLRPGFVPSLRLQSPSLPPRSADSPARSCRQDDIPVRRKTVIINVYGRTVVLRDSHHSGGRVDGFLFRPGQLRPLPRQRPLARHVRAGTPGAAGGARHRHAARRLARRRRGRLDGRRPHPRHATSTWPRTSSTTRCNFALRVDQQKIPGDLLRAYTATSN